MPLDPATRQIGLSLGADLCWPSAFEDIVQRLDLSIPFAGESVRFATERVTVEPFDLRYQPKFDVVLDRITHWYNISREWVKKITLMDGTYVLNNPWAIQAMEKHTTYCAMMRLGMPIPETFMLPPKLNPDEGDVKVTLERYGKLFDLADVGEKVGYPAFLKPYDGGGWVGVTKVDDAASLHAAYDKSGARVQHLQAGVQDWDLFVRGIGIGPQVMICKYDPSAPLHARYVVDFQFLDAGEWMTATRITRTINAFFRWDFNSCEMLRSGGVLHPIDFANACPDSQITSLHFYFPQLVKALLRWSLFAATVQRRPSLSFDWDRFFDIADTDAPFEEKLLHYDALALQHFDAERFAAFCAEHLSHLDEVALEYFQTDRFHQVVRQKVSALYPAHEIDKFTDHFYGLVQFWCRTEKDRLVAQAAAREASGTVESDALEDPADLGSRDPATEELSAFAVKGGLGAT